MSKTIEEAAREYAKLLWESGMYDKATPANEEDMSCAFKAGAKYMIEYIFQIYNDCGGDMDFVEWKLNRKDNE